MLKTAKYLKGLPSNRLYSVKHATKSTIKYTNTINLPKTKFPSRLSPPKREEVEKKLVEVSVISNLAGEFNIYF